ncbi:Uncharacterized protein family UPF0193 [Carpediemonas membranifera]|uniref:Uncharacterized protein family UPF0193 n=1 Tax=Carpediemonas membranifera TaxID=201153 RepID=A0A8J6AY94_9EUKA|nr:Uncharacterized protein family UPF0193 [Carpediemonas membranifera]|eukprot:KAG9395390.1 Uncharacterized protein family UPF0193 [Carpediemonas membranifera]
MVQDTQQLLNSMMKKAGLSQARQREISTGLKSSGQLPTRLQHRHVAHIQPDPKPQMPTRHMRIKTKQEIEAEYEANKADYITNKRMPREPGQDREAMKDEWAHRQAMYGRTAGPSQVSRASVTQPKPVERKKTFQEEWEDQIMEEIKAREGWVQSMEGETRAAEKKKIEDLYVALLHPPKE